MSERDFTGLVIGALVGVAAMAAKHATDSWWVCAAVFAGLMALTIERDAL